MNVGEYREVTERKYTQILKNQEEYTSMPHQSILIHKG